MKIKLLITGGTIDDIDYEKIEDINKYACKKTYILEMLKQGKCKVDIKSKVLMMRDSSFITDSDRKKILQECKDCKENRIIIRSFFYQRLKSSQKIRLHNLAGEYYIKNSGIASISESIYHFEKASNYKKIAQILIENGFQLVAQGYVKEISNIVKTIDTKYQIDDETKISLFVIRGNILRIEGKYDEAIRVYETIIPLYKSQKQSDRIARVYMNIADLQYLKNDWESAYKTLNQAKKLNEKNPCENLNFMI